MRSIVVVIAALFFALPARADHSQHTKHGFILMGTSEVFASHIVAVSPHNFQVDMQINLDSSTLRKYQLAKSENPNATLMLVLDDLDISEIQTASKLEGSIILKEADGSSRPVAEHVSIPAHDFKISYFNELLVATGDECLPSVPGLP